MLLVAMETVSALTLIFGISLECHICIGDYTHRNVTEKDGDDDDDDARQTVVRNPSMSLPSLLSNRLFRASYMFVLTGMSISQSQGYGPQQVSTSIVDQLEKIAICIKVPSQNNLFTHEDPTGLGGNSVF